MKPWFLLVLAGLAIVGGCSQASDAPTTPAKSEPPKTEPGKAQATTSNNELSINPNAGNLNQAGSSMKGK